MRHYIDFRQGRKSADIRLMFPGWERGETIAFLSPHDDDALLGAGYLIDAVLAEGGRPQVLIFCNGDCGYSRPDQKDSIVAVRHRETLDAYARLGVDSQALHFFDIADFSLMGRVSNRLETGEGIFKPLLRLLRRQRVSRAIFANPYFEHWDHSAVFAIGAYAVPHAADPVLADLGDPVSIRSFLIYSVWGDFAPDPGNHSGARADLGLAVSGDVEERIGHAASAFASQGEIIDSILRRRRQRSGGGTYLELYQSFHPRRPIDFAPYHRLLAVAKED